MKNYLKTHPFAGIGILAIPMLLYTISMEILFPKSHPEGYQSFIIAFEFARTTAQIHNLFSGFGEDVFRNINSGNYIDFGFLLTYGLFLVLFFYKAAKVFDKKYLFAGIPISVVVILADIFENIYLLKITGIYTPLVADSVLTPLLNKLYIATWIKWGGLALIFALFSVRSMGMRILSRFEGVVFIIPAVFSLWAVSNNPMGVTRFTLSIILAFFLLIFYSLYYKINTIEQLKKDIAD